MDQTAMELAQLIYGENASEDFDTMVMTGSSALNRLESGKEKEFGGSLPEVMQKGYYAVSQNSPMYQQALSGDFPDEKSQESFKRALQVSYGLLTGTIPRHKAQFFFKKGEATALRKKLKPTGKVGKYETYSY